MIDVDRQAAYWHDGAIEEWQVATELMQLGRTRHSLFFIHLALEKMLKAHVCRHTKSTPPRVHNLTRLAELSGLQLSEEHIKVLAEINKFNIEGRYNPMLASLPDITKAQQYLAQAGDVLQWLIKQL
jgi:HEPN domain-containing protein